MILLTIWFDTFIEKGIGPDLLFYFPTYIISIPIFILINLVINFKNDRNQSQTHSTTSLLCQWIDHLFDHIHQSKYQVHNIMQSHSNDDWIIFFLFTFGFCSQIT